tara:strand:+ start:4346 stop:4660 length:315 start_codon:yes stop_codon:yes gene_type:complete
LPSDERNLNSAAWSQYRLCCSEKARKKLSVQANSTFAGYMGKHETYTIPSAAFERSVEHSGIDAVQKLHAGSIAQITNIFRTSPLFCNVFHWLKRCRRHANPII